QQRHERIVADVADAPADLANGALPYAEAGKSRVRKPAKILFSAKQRSIHVVEFLQAFRRVRAQV
ncbi:MAG TPA: hypothetical protein VK555_01970, partial [Terriglobales bacterium]|nr:hypothetical protein [Terriglobales bacterium]